MSGVRFAQIGTITGLKVFVSSFLSSMLEKQIHTTDKADSYDTSFIQNMTPTYLRNWSKGLVMLVLASKETCTWQFDNALI